MLVFIFLKELKDRLKYHADLELRGIVAEVAESTNARDKITEYLNKAADYIVMI